MMTYEPLPGEMIEETAKAMILLMQESHDDVHASFNDIP